MSTTRCRTCGAAIFWCRTTKGKLMPVDAAPVPAGNVVVEDGVAEVLGPLTLAALPAGTPRYRSHFVNCPEAETHQKEK